MHKNEINSLTKIDEHTEIIIMLTTGSIIPLGHMNNGKSTIA